MQCHRRPANSASSAAYRLLDAGTGRTSLSIFPLLRPLFVFMPSLESLPCVPRTDNFLSGSLSSEIRSLCSFSFFTVGCFGLAGPIERHSGIQGRALDVRLSRDVQCEATNARSRR
jgi:hypothetical protein